MIQSYLFDPVQVSSPGYVNEVNSGKLDDNDSVKLKGRQSSQALVQPNDLPREHIKRTCSQSRPPAGTPPQGHAGWEHGAGKTGALNGIGPTLQPTGDPGSHQGDKGSWASMENSVHPTEVGDAREQGCELHPSEETRVILNRDSGTSPKVLEELEHVLQIPAPDYPQPGTSATDNRGHDPVAGTHLGVGEHDLNVPFSLKRSWDSLNEAVTTELLDVSLQEEAPAQVTQGVDSRNGWGDAQDTPDNRLGEVAEEDAAVAEALAALEAATAGEDVDEAD